MEEKVSSEADRNISSYERCLCVRIKPHVCGVFSATSSRSATRLSAEECESPLGENSFSKVK